MRRDSPQFSLPALLHCLTPSISELDEGVVWSMRQPASTCRARPAPASRPATAGSCAQTGSIPAAFPHFLQKLLLLLTCCFPLSPALGDWDFKPVLRESGAGWSSQHSAVCDDFRPAQLDYSQHRNMEYLAKQLVAQERQLLANRANHGIYHEIHAPVLEEMAELALRMNNVHKAHEYKEAVLLLKKRLHQKDNRSLAKAYSQWADWHFARFQENVGRPSVLLGNRQDSFLLTLHFSVSDEYYSKALNLLDQESAPACERKNLVSRLKVLYFSALRMVAAPAHDNFRLPGDIDHAHQMGNVVPYRISAATIRDLLTPDADSAVAGDPTEAKESALQLVELADWYALFNNRKDARIHYERAWHSLHTAGFPQQEIASILSFGLPIPEPDELLHARTGAERGYIDVDIELDAHGIPAEVTLDDTQGHDAKVMRSLLRKIHRSRFRPVVLDGAASDRQLVALRYIY